MATARALLFGPTKRALLFGLRPGLTSGWPSWTGPSGRVVETRNPIGIFLQLLKQRQPLQVCCCGWGLMGLDAGDPRWVHGLCWMAGEADWQYISSCFDEKACPRAVLKSRFCARALASRGLQCPGLKLAGHHPHAGGKCEEGQTPWHQVFSFTTD